jgi:hypothetical protein
MKSRISILAVTLALAFTGPAFAQDVKNRKDRGRLTNTCSEKKM